VAWMYAPLIYRLLTPSCFFRELLFSQCNGVWHTGRTVTEDSYPPDLRMEGVAES
jgi:hypothetical protein